jgi:hypothetical protein
MYTVTLSWQNLPQSHSVRLTCVVLCPILAVLGTRLECLSVVILGRLEDGALGIVLVEGDVISLLLIT